MRNKELKKKKGNHCGLTPTSSDSHHLTDGTKHRVQQKQREYGRTGVWSSAETGKEGGNMFSLSACLAASLICFLIPNQ